MPRTSLLLPLLVVAAAMLRIGPIRAEENLPSDDAAPRFSRHVEAVFSRLGCNGGACHGAVQGKNGFRLSLFAARPEQDYEQLLRGAASRRVNPFEPERSLLLLKATAQVAHGGGRVAEVGSPEYELLRRWLLAGAPPDAPEESRVEKLVVTPPQVMLREGETAALRVEAAFRDGSSEDVTSLCSFATLDDAVATVDQEGRVSAAGVGDAAVVVRYRAEPVMAMIVVPQPSAGPPPQVAANNFIDRHVLAKLERLNIPPAELADDATFLRRAQLDVTGRLPTPDEVRRFLADTDPDKRARKIDELLDDPDYAALWALKFCDLLRASDFGVYADGLSEERDAPRFHAWVRARLEENTPYDEFARRILTATGREGRSLEDWAGEVLAIEEGYATPRTDVTTYSNRKTLDVYWQRKDATGVSGTLQIAHAFLGLRLECAQCHRHPHDVWQQDDLLSFANFFMHVREVGFKGDNEKKFPETAALFKKYTEEGKQLAEQAKKLKAEKGDAEKIRELEQRGKLLQDSVAKRILHAEIRHLPDARWASVTSPLGTQESKQFRLLGESEPVEVPADRDPRELVADWMCRGDNPYFARAIVNRVWAHYFGRGIVDPPDDLSPFNPPTHPELLDEFCRRFVESGFDLKWLHRTILASRTYQQSSLAGAASAADRANYAYFYPRRLSAEVMLDALNQATGTRENMDMKYYHWPEGMRTVEIPYRPRSEFVNFVFDQFGRPQRNSAVQCDCERDNGPSVIQVLALLSHPHVSEKVAAADGNVARLAKQDTTDAARIEELFLLALGRLPSDQERDACLAYVAASESPEAGLRGVLWSLLNTKEFVLQH